MIKRNNVVLNIIFPVLLGIGMLYFFQDKLRKSEEIGLGEGNSAFFPVINNYPIHISEAKQAGLLKEGWIKRGSKELYLWMGNSQLHGINRYKPGNTNCVEFLFDHLKDKNIEVAGISYPNANLQEFLTSVLYYSNQFPLKKIIMPVFYDDMREDGIRDVINTNTVVEAIQQDSIYFAEVPGIKQLKIKDTFTAGKADDNYKGIKETAQDISERYLDNKMETAWRIWSSRPEYRGNLFNALYIFRNYALNIKPGTVRKMIPGRFNDNYNAFKAIIKFCSDRNIPMLIYIPPLRNDIPAPYDMNAYYEFEKRVEEDCRNAKVTFLNLERLVPNQYWGMKVSSSSYNNNDMEADFMHFQEAGHRLVADTIFKTLVSKP